MREAEFYSINKDGRIQCNLCPHYCILSEGIESRCQSRKVIDGKLFATNYGETISLSIDPIEKKPLYHFYPDSEIFSIGPNSCNLSCSFCQNFSISQQKQSTQYITKEIILETCENNNVNMVAFTYTEPLMWYEFILDSAKYLQDFGIKIVLVTNGFINIKPLKKLLPFVDAMNIDLKSFTNKFYHDLCKGKLNPVLETIKLSFKYCHIEVTNLLISDKNDDLDNIKNLVDFVASVSKNIPLHFSRYYPQYKLTNPPTNLEILDLAQDIGRKKLNYVYQGNVTNPKVKNTICPNCGEVLVERNYILKNNITSGKCPKCQEKIYGEW